ncbi:hypothetical protein OIU85_030067 [Salix viminalis]|uniref:Uncharacterized protein n=1 Tax=Salix viminalis TaxID=40686 RepID=A0A9Q0QD16_SALVM|nr:hypothetical protein OIU85_030067 [Salix viminalis]
MFQTKQEELEDALAISIDTTPTIPGAYGSSKNLLVHGCELAQQLQKLETEKWKITSEVWIEKRTHAASQCEWRELLLKIPPPIPMFQNCILFARMQDAILRVLSSF